MVLGRSPWTRLGGGELPLITSHMVTPPAADAVKGGPALCLG